MNQIIGEMFRSCRSQISIYGLHRQGTGPKGGAIDLHGSDFAVGLVTATFRKMAVFQVKRPDAGAVKIEHGQTSAAMVSGLPRQSFFVLSADASGAFNFRVQGVETLWNSWPNNSAGVPQGSRTEHIANWSVLKDWLDRWLQCTEGTMSTQVFDQANELLSGLPKAKGRVKGLPSAYLRIAIENAELIQEGIE